MSMKDVNKKLTICEVLRQINDITNDPAIKEKLSLAKGMAKKMVKKLYEYNKEFDKDWWDNNPEYEKSLLKRMNDD